MDTYINVDVSQCEMLQKSEELQKSIWEVRRLAEQFDFSFSGFTIGKAGENTKHFRVELVTDSEEIQECLTEMTELAKALKSKTFNLSKLLTPKLKETH